MKPVVLKKNGARQNPLTQLTKETARALVQRILCGETLYPTERKIELVVEAPEGEKTITLSSNTIDTWCKRGTVIPENGETLRDLLNDAREEYRTRMAKQMDRERKDIIDKKFNRVISMRTNEPVIIHGKNKSYLMKDENGNVIRVENANLLRIQMDTAKWLAERIDSDRYGKVEKTENRHLVFSLSDLRREKEKRDNATMPKVQET